MNALVRARVGNMPSCYRGDLRRLAQTRNQKTNEQKKLLTISFWHWFGLDRQKKPSKDDESPKPQEFGRSARRKNPCLFSGFPLLFTEKASVGGSG